MRAPPPSSQKTTTLLSLTARVKSPAFNAMDASENSGSRFGRSIWTVWGYLTGAVARYLRPEVTDEGNQNDVVLKNKANEINSEEKENEAEKNVEGKKCNENENNTEVKCVLPEARIQVALAQWEKTDVVMDDHTELQVNATKKQTYHCAVWSIGTNHDESVSCDDVDSDGHKQKSGTSTLDVQIDDKKEEKQKSEARVEKKPVSSDASCKDNVERKVSETEEQPFEIVDSKQKDGSNKDKKEQKCDHEDDNFQECEFMREDQNNAEVTIKPELYGQDVEQKKLGTEYTTDFPKEKGVESVIDEKEQQTVVQNQELDKVEDFEDEGTESQVKDGDSKEDGAFSNPLEIGRLEVIKKHSEEIIENISENELGSKDTTEQDKDVQESEQLNWLDTCELAGTGICNIEEVHDGRLGETQTTQTKNVDETKSVLLNLEDTLPRTSEEIFEEIVASNEPGRTTDTVVDSFFETVATSKDNLQSDISKQDTSQTGTGSPVVAIKTEAMFSDIIVCELSGELRKGPEVGLVKTGAVDQVKTVEISLGSFEEIKTNLDEPNTQTEEYSQRDTVVPHSVELELKDSKEAIKIEQDIRGTEYTTDFPKEKGVERVIDEKEQQTVVQNQELEKVEDFEDEGTESQVKDGDSKEDGAFSNPLEIGRLEVIKKHSEEIIENEHISKNELGSKDTTEQDKDVQESEQLNWLDTCELAGTGICNIEEVHDGRLGETQTTQTKNVDETKSVLLNLEDTLPRASEEIFEEIVASNEPGRTTDTVVDSFFETVATSKDNLQSDISKQDTPQTGTGSPVVAIKTEAMFSDLIVCELSGELRKGPEVGLVKTGAVDQVKTVEISLGSFEEIKTNLDEPNTQTEEYSQRDTVVPHSVELELKDSKEAIEIEQDIETPIDCLNATLQEIDKTEFSLKKHVELRTALTFETVETKTCSKKAKVKTFETNIQADSELDLTTERECKLSQATLDTVSESLEEGESIVVCAIAGTEPYPVDLKLDAEDAPDVIVAKIGPVGSQTELTRPLSPAEFLVETLDLKIDSYIYSEGQENREIRLLDETEALKTTLEYVEEITNQVLKEMMEMENNVGQDVEPLVGLSTEKLGDAEFQELPTGTLVLEQENMEVSKFLAGTEESIEMEVETSICEVVKKQIDDPILSPVSETTDDVEHIEEKGAAGETVICCHEDIIEISKSGIKRRFENVSKDVPEVKIDGEEKAPTTDWPTTVDLDLQEFEDSSLDFSVQKSRIAVKNPLVRPPKDPRKLIFKTSVEPFLPKPPACGLFKGGQGIAVSVPSKGFIGFKLPGVGTEMPILRKTEFGKKARESGEAESQLQAQEQQKSVAVTEDSVKQEPASLKPKWTPPRHTGMGSPLMMAELKGKLKKPLKE
ncbi:uncharacterized protein LOC127633516 [Xyrauchen texanus]|uniref:uncharacterized protein LOC127633516 n=1 Tax=Xyrauchen texanus TaxID=154827 RepID=UPI0022428DF3|nr:uncharacterized protein LOC127633516 [Xyrauchen texanus]